MKVALIALAKNEERYLKEWIDHHLNIGIDHIFIIDNNDLGNDSLIKFVEENNYNDVVSIKDFRGYKSVDQGAQYYQQMIQINNEYDWCLFTDIDEFLVIIPSFCENNIKTYISKHIYNFHNNFGLIPNIIHIGWLIYGDNNQIEYKDEPVQERFKLLSERIFFAPNNHDTCIGKMLVNIKTITGFFRNPHMIYEGNAIVSINGGLNRGEINFMQGFKHNDAVIKHYFTKSLEEYLDRKIPNLCHYTYKDYKEVIDSYFAVNEWTEEKQDFIDKYIENAKL